MTGVASRKRKEEEATPPISTIHPSVVLEEVLNQLGKPKDLSKICESLTRATPITQASFRVNIYRDLPSSVLTGTNAKLTDSFWVVVNKEGKIVRSDPAIERKYDFPVH